MSRPADQVVNIVIAGLGGQGVLTSSDIVAEAAFRTGADVKKSEVHGMAQRGGSVASDVRYGPRVLSPMVPVGGADYLLVLSQDQVENNMWRLRPDGVLLEPQPASPPGGGAPIIEQIGNPRCINVAIVGMLSVFLDIADKTWDDVLRASLPEKLLEVNLEAFELGRREGLAQKQMAMAR
jgi:indolepyruvate ferredoxin oxidoreductase, beta subunit